MIFKALHRKLEIEQHDPTENGENWGTRKGIHNVVDCVLYIIYYFENHLDNLGEYLTQEIGKGCTYIMNV